MPNEIVKYVVFSGVMDKHVKIIFLFKTVHTTGCSSYIFCYKT